MTRIQKTRLTACVVAILLTGSMAIAHAQLTVFDPSNYQQNLLAAARTLEQINNQVRTLQNQVQSIQRMDQNLVRLGSTLSPDLQRTLADIQAQLRAGDGIALQLQQTQDAYTQLFPKQASAALSTDDVLRNVRSRWNEEYAAFQRTALLQGQIVDGIAIDSNLLADAMLRSRSSLGALEAAQAGNELTGLSVKQSLGLQGLLAAQARADTLSHARALATEEDARQRFKSFIGTGSAYTAGQYTSAVRNVGNVNQAY